MIFIRHAEPDKNGNITSEGALKASNIVLPEGPKFTSELERSYQTLLAINESIFHCRWTELNEWNKSKETEKQFKKRVKDTLKNLPKDAVVIGHSRWMAWAYWLLKGEPALGFDYLESFEA